MQRPHFNSTDAFAKQTFQVKSSKVKMGTPSAGRTLGK